MTLTDYLKQNNMSLTAFSALGNWPIATVWCWQHNTRMPRLAALKKIMQITNGAVTIHDFGPGSEDDNQAKI